MVGGLLCLQLYYLEEEIILVELLLIQESRASWNAQVWNSPLVLWWEGGMVRTGAGFALCPQVGWMWVPLALT